jgi:hypothetical protein
MRRSLMRQPGPAGQRLVEMRVPIDQCRDGEQAPAVDRPAGPRRRCTCRDQRGNPLVVDQDAAAEAVIETDIRDGNRPWRPPPTGSRSCSIRAISARKAMQP